MSTKQRGSDYTGTSRSEDRRNLRYKAFYSFEEKKSNNYVLSGGAWKKKGRKLKVSRVSSRTQLAAVKKKYYRELLGIKMDRNVKKLRDSHPSVTQAWGPELVITGGWREQRSCVLQLVLRVENLREPRERNTKEFWEWQPVKWINDKFVRLFVALSHFFMAISHLLSPPLSLSHAFRVLEM